MDKRNRPQTHLSRNSALNICISICVQIENPKCTNKPKVCLFFVCLFLMASPAMAMETLENAGEKACIKCALDSFACFFDDFISDVLF